MGMKLGLQLYTVRELIEKDFAGTLEKIAEMGYQGVEFAGYGGLPASKMSELLKRLGLKAVGSHVRMDRLLHNLQEEIEYNLEIGNPYLVCPWLEYRSLQDFHDTARVFNKIGYDIKSKGLQFCYHNHGHELRRFGDTYGLDIIFGETEAELVQAEFDTYWIQHAGIEPIAYIRKYAGRCPLIHQKDMETGPEKGFTEIGNGIMDIAGIAKAGQEIGAKWFIVEQDVCKRPPLESVKISCDYVIRHGLWEN